LEHFLWISEKEAIVMGIYLASLDHKPDWSHLVDRVARYVDWCIQYKMAVQMARGGGQMFNVIDYVNGRMDKNALESVKRLAQKEKPRGGGRTEVVPKTDKIEINSENVRKVQAISAKKPLTERPLQSSYYGKFAVRDVELPKEKTDSNASAALKAALLKVSFSNGRKEAAATVLFTAQESVAIEGDFATGREPEKQGYKPKNIVNGNVAVPCAKPIEIRNSVAIAAKLKEMGRVNLGQLLGIAQSFANLSGEFAREAQRTEKYGDMYKQMKIIAVGKDISVAGMILEAGSTATLRSEFFAFAIAPEPVAQRIRKLPAPKILVSAQKVVSFAKPSVSVDVAQNLKSGVDVQHAHAAAGAHSRARHIQQMPAIAQPQQLSVAKVEIPAKSDYQSQMQPKRLASANEPPPAGSREKNVGRKPLSFTSQTASALG